MSTRPGAAPGDVSGARYLSRRALLALTGAAAVMLGAGFVFGVMLDDVTGGHGLASSDARHLRWFTAHRSPILVDAAKVLAHIGSAGFLVVGTVAAGLMLWRWGAELVLAVAPVLSLVVAGVITALGKTLVHRSNPVILHRAAGAIGPFPSGHAADSTATFVAIAIVVSVTVLQSTARRVALLGGAGLLAGAIGLSRLELGVHWPTDVVAGWSLGLLVAVTVSTTATLMARLGPPPDHRAVTPGNHLRAWFIRVVTVRRTRPVPRMA